LFIAIAVDDFVAYQCLTGSILGKYFLQAFCKMVNPLAGITFPDGRKVEPAVKWFLRLSRTGRKGFGTAKTL
jgi:hypothetical protein